MCIRDSDDNDYDVVVVVIALLSSVTMTMTMTMMMMIMMMMRCVSVSAFVTPMMSDSQVLSRLTTIKLALMPSFLLLSIAYPSPQLLQR